MFICRIQLGEFVGDREPPNLDVKHSTNDVAADESFSMYSYTTSSGTGMSSVDDHHSRGVSAQSMHSSYVLPFQLEYWSNSPLNTSSIVYSHYKRFSSRTHPAFGQTRISTGFTSYPQLPPLQVVLRLSSPPVLDPLLVAGQAKRCRQCRY